MVSASISVLAAQNMPHIKVFKSAKLRSTSGTRWARTKSSKTLLSSPASVKSSGQGGSSDMRDTFFVLKGESWAFPAG